MYHMKVCFLSIHLMDGEILFVISDIFVISVVNKQYKTQEINSLGLEKLVRYIRYFVISDLFILSFHCINLQHKLSLLE